MKLMLMKKDRVQIDFTPKEAAMLRAIVFEYRDLSFIHAEEKSFCKRLHLLIRLWEAQHEEKE